MILLSLGQLQSLISFSVYMEKYHTLDINIIAKIPYFVPG